MGKGRKKEVRSGKDSTERAKGATGIEVERHGRSKGARAKKRVARSCPLAWGGRAKFLGRKRWHDRGHAKILAGVCFPIWPFCGSFELYFGWGLCLGYFGVFCGLKEGLYREIKCGVLGLKMRENERMMEILK